MRDRKRERIGFPLRLPRLLKEQASYLAHKDGVSLNSFITLAVAERIGRLESPTSPQTFRQPHQTVGSRDADKHYKPSGC
jgi:HicB family